MDYGRLRGLRWSVLTFILLLSISLTGPAPAYAMVPQPEPGAFSAEPVENAETAGGAAGTTLSAGVNASARWTRTFRWTIAKSANPSSLNLQAGESGSSQYTVTLTRDAGTVEAFVSGVVTVENGGGRATEGLAITVSLTRPPSGTAIASAVVDLSACPVLQPGQTHSYAYRLEIPSQYIQPGAGFNVTAQVTITNHSGSLGKPKGPRPSGNAALPSQITLVNDTVHVDDSNGLSWTMSGSGSQTYSRTFTCGDEGGGNAGNGIYDNRATIRETGQYADARVIVKCPPAPTPSRTPTVTKTPTKTLCPSKTPTNTPAPTNTPSKTPTKTLCPSKTPTDTRIPSATPTHTRIPSATPTSTRIPSATPTSTRIPSATPTRTRVPSATPSPTPTTVCSAIGDYVWFDEDGDGIQDADEHGLPGITVRLFAPDGALLAEMETDSNGLYLFDCLPAGDYAVIVDTSDPHLPPNLWLSTVGWYRVNLPPSTRFLDADFGFAPLAGGDCGCPSYLLFESTRDGQLEIYKLGPLPEGLSLNLTQDGATDAEAARSPDGHWVAYQTDLHGPQQLYRVSEDGLVRQRLTNVAADTIDPQWSPGCNEGRIAYASHEQGNWDIYVLSLSSLSATRLTAGPHDDVNPNWSPDGREIAFETNRDGRWQIYIMNNDGSDQRPLFTSAGDDRNPVWSLDGSRLAFESNRSGRWQVYVYDLATGAVINVSNTPGIAVKPAWSPDGRQLLFQAADRGQWDVYRVDAGGSNRIVVAGSPVDEEDPGWSCDGSQVFYQMPSEHGLREVYMAGPDGAHAQRVTDVPIGDDTIPLWCAPENDNARTFALDAPAALDRYVYLPLLTR